MPNADPFTTLQRAFILLYVENLNASPKKTQTELAIEAGYKPKGAHVTASRLLSDPKIIAEIDRLFDLVAMSRNETLKHLTDIARGTIKDCDLASRLRALDMLAKYHNLTNNSTHRIEDWKTDAIKLIRDGKIDYDILVQTVADFGESESLAIELFKQAGVTVEMNE